MELDRRCKIKMCAYGSCRTEFYAKGDSGAAKRKYCDEHKTIARKEYQRLRYLKNKPPIKICKNFRCKREIRRQGKKISCRKFCTELCYKREKLWNQRYKRGFDRQLSLIKGMLLTMR